MKFTSAITFLSLSACISPTFARGKKKKDKADEIPPPVCGSDIQCGGIAYNGEVKLTEDLICTTASGDCAITLEGEDAVLDCNQYMIDGDSSLGRGICILKGASAINCHVQKFGVGIYVENGGEVKDCEVMFNVAQGILIENEASSTRKMKISNTYTHDNVSDGINFYGYGESFERSKTSIEIANVKSNNNDSDGMRFGGNNVKLEVQVKDSEASNNDIDGIYIFAFQAAVDVELDGIISRYNQNSGVTLDLDGPEGNVKVKVTGDVNLYNNGLSGFFVGGAAVVVERRGALNSCGHSKDIDNDGGGTFSGNGYTCTNVNPPGVNPSAPGVNPPNTITCDPCPCPQPQ